VADMPSYKFTQDGNELYCYVRNKKHLVVAISGMRFLLPMSIASDQQALSATKDVLAKQVDLFEKALEEGIPVEEAVGLLAAGALLRFEFSQDSIGDLLGITKPASELE
jgi:hypothetical protein